MSCVYLSVFNLSGPRKTINGSNGQRAFFRRDRRGECTCARGAAWNCHSWCALLCWWQDEMCNYPLFLLIPSAASFPAFCSPLLHLLVGWSVLFSCPLRRNPAQFRLTYLKGNARSGEHENIFRNDWRRIRPEDCVVAFPTTHTYILLTCCRRTDYGYYFGFGFFFFQSSSMFWPMKKGLPTFWQDSLTSLSSRCCVLMWCITAQKALSVALIRESRSNYPDRNFDWHIDSIVKKCKVTKAIVVKFNEGQ